MKLRARAARRRRFGCIQAAFPLWVAALILQVSPARAQQACEGLANLRRVAAEDRAFLGTLCRFGPEQAQRWRQAAVAEHARLNDILTRLVSQQSWEAGLVARVLPTGLFDVPAGIAGDAFNARCDARKELSEAVSATRAGHKHPERLLGVEVPLVLPEACDLAAQTHPGSVSLAVIAPADMEVRVLPAGEHPYRLPVARQQGRPVVAQNRGLFYARLPFNRRYVVVVSTRPGADRESDFPTVFSGVAHGDRTHYTDEAKSLCVSVQIKTDQAISVRFDGTAVRIANDTGIVSETLWVPMTGAGVEAHALSVLRRGSKRGSTRPSVLAERELELDPDRSHSCEQVRLDLTSKATRHSIGLFEVDAERCLAAGVDSAKLHHYVASFLRAAGRKLVDLRAWSHTTQFFAQFRQALDALGGKPAGADRGQLDSVANLGTAAAELMRQGFGSLLSLELRCTRNEDALWDYSFLAKRWDLGELARRDRDPLGGVDLEGVLSTEIELARSRDALGPAIELALARLHDLPAATFLPLPAAMHFGSPITAEAEVRLSKRESEQPITVTLSSHPLSSLQQCSTLHDVHSLRREREFKALNGLSDWTEVGRYELDAGTGGQRVPMTVSPSAPVPTLLKLSLRPDDPLATSYQCVDFSRAGARLWTSLLVAWSNGSDVARSEDVRSMLGLVGLDRATPIPWLSWGLGLGVAHTQRRGLTPSDWDSVENVLVTPKLAGFDRGRLPYEITDWGMLAHANVSVHASVCELWNIANACSVPALRDVLLTARFLLSLGVYRTHRNTSDARLADDQTRTPTSVDVGLLLQPGVLYYASDSWAFDVRFAVGYSGLAHRFCGPGKHDECYSPLLMGGALGASWEL